MKKWAFLKDYNCDGKADIFCRSDSLAAFAYIAMITQLPMDFNLH